MKSFGGEKSMRFQKDLGLIVLSKRNGIMEEIKIGCIKFYIETSTSLVKSFGWGKSNVPSKRPWPLL